MSKKWIIPLISLGGMSLASLSLISLSVHIHLDSSEASRPSANPTASAPNQSSAATPSSKPSKPVQSPAPTPVAASRTVPQVPVDLVHKNQWHMGVPGWSEWYDTGIPLTPGQCFRFWGVGHWLVKVGNQVVTSQDYAMSGSSFAIGCVQTNVKTTILIRSDRDKPENLYVTVYDNKKSLDEDM